MPSGQEEHKKDIRKGIPHHQQEFPGFSTDGLERKTASDETEPTPGTTTPVEEKSPAEEDVTSGKKSRSNEPEAITEHKKHSVLRDRFMRNDDDDERDDSMVARVISDLLHDEEGMADEGASDEEVDETSEPAPGQEAKEDNVSAEIRDEEPGHEEVEETTVSGPERAQLAKRYEAIHNRLFVVDIVLTIGAVLAFLSFGGSTNLRDFIHYFTKNVWVVPIIYAAIATTAYYFVLLIPLHAVDFHFENKFNLNTQSFASWLGDNFKSLILNMLIMMLFLEVTYFLLRLAPLHWWIWAAGVWVLFGILMTNLVPILILPLFYKLTPLKDDPLRDRLKNLAERVKMKVLDVYEMKLSRKTKKANAMLSGLGNTKRIILGDTLLEKYTGEEIETIIAHELGHHYHKHVPKLIALGTIVTFAGFFVAARFLAATIARLDYLHISGVDDVAGFPLLIMAISVFGLLTMPLRNYVSRTLEKQADRFALRLTDRPAAFIAAMKKIADQNLADKEPSPVIEFLLHDHPSISKRIVAAEDYSARKRA